MYKQYKSDKVQGKRPDSQGQGLTLEARANDLTTKVKAKVEDTSHQAPRPRTTTLSDIAASDSRQFIYVPVVRYTITLSIDITMRKVSYRGNMFYLRKYCSRNGQHRRFISAQSTVITLMYS